MDEGLCFVFRLMMLPLASYSLSFLFVMLKLISVMTNRFYVNHLSHFKPKMLVARSLVLSSYLPREK